MACRTHRCGSVHSGDGVWVWTSRGPRNMVFGCELNSHPNTPSPAVHAQYWCSIVQLGWDFFRQMLRVYHLTSMPLPIPWLKHLLGSLSICSDQSCFFAYEILYFLERLFMALNCSIDSHCMFMILSNSCSGAIMVYQSRYEWPPYMCILIPRTSCSSVAVAWLLRFLMSHTF